jgi:hypothetical protein
MAYFEPKIDHSEVVLANPKDVLISRCRNMMLDIALKKTHNIGYSPTYYRGLALSLENTFIVESASEVDLNKQLEGNGDS